MECPVCGEVIRKGLFEAHFWKHLSAPTDGQYWRVCWCGECILASEQPCDKKLVYVGEDFWTHFKNREHLREHFLSYALLGD